MIMLPVANPEPTSRTMERDGSSSPAGGGGFQAGARLALSDVHDEIPLDEPKTPLWLTAVGGGLFFLLAIAGLAALASEPDEANRPAAVASASAAPAASPKPPPVVAQGYIISDFTIFTE